MIEGARALVIGLVPEERQRSCAWCGLIPAWAGLSGDLERWQVGGAVSGRKSGKKFPQARSDDRGHVIS